MTTEEIMENKKAEEIFDDSSDGFEERNDIKQYKSSKKHSAKSIKRVKFLPSEDKKIIELASIYGVDWKQISQSFGPSRTKRQLRERWQNYLNPECNPTYTEEEDCMLLELVDKIGTKWAKIAEKIGKKSAISCRNRHRILIKEMNKKSSLKSTKTSSAQTNLLNKLDESDKKKDEKALNLNLDDNSKKGDSSNIDTLFDNSKFDDDCLSMFFFSTPSTTEECQLCFDYDEYLFEYNLYDI